MTAYRLCVLVIVLAWPLGAIDRWGDPPTCTTHFFDWYAVSATSPLVEIEKRWTYQLDWQRLGISPEDIGNSVHYYEVQCQKIREAGFDGIHYEWHANPVKPQFCEALRATGLRMAMFYDMEIRFSGQGQFITPTDEFARTFVDDVAAFYASLPKPLWLYDRNGCLPIVVYGYAFDTRVTDPLVWDRFYGAIVSGVEQRLGEQVVFHWTNNGTPQQMYGFQHFPEIQSYIFNEANGQTQVNARAVTFVVHYDDLGVSFARGGPRSRWICNDIRYLQEALWLAKHTDPDLVFNYGWNELYEGEHLLPDSLWGSWRYDVAAAMVRDIKDHTHADLPRVLIIADDFLTQLHQASSETAIVLRREMQLLTRLRSLVPQAEVLLPGSGRNLAEYAMVFSLNTLKDPAEEAALASCPSTVVYTNPQVGAESAMTRKFTDSASRPLRHAELGPENEYVVIVRPVDIDLARFPFLEFRWRNTPSSLFHIRYRGETADGREVEAWLETSATDDRQSGGEWVADRANIAQIARQAAGEPITRLTRVEIILDDLEPNGQFELDIDYLRCVGPAGEPGWDEPFDTADNWSVHASFEGVPNARRRFGFSARREGDLTFGRVELQAVVSELLPKSLDQASRMIQPRVGVRVLADAEFEGTKVPVLLVSDRACWMNTYTPTDACWEILYRELLHETLTTGVMFGSFSHTVSREAMTTATDSAAMVIREAPLPLDRIRLVAPPELDQPLPHTLPVGYEDMELRIITSERRSIPCPDAESQPPSITLQPGEVVELVRTPPQE